MQNSRIKTATKALRQLGFTQVALNLLYKLGLASGHYQRSIRPPAPIDSLRLKPGMPMPDPEILRLCLGENGMRDLLAEAGEITAGNFRQFGAAPIVLNLIPEGPLAHWTAYETGKVRPKPATDIKMIWEPARFGWAFVLGRAYHVSRDEQYAAAFWRLFEIFNSANPAYLGPNWTSGQEIGLRLMAWVWAAQIFTQSQHSHPARLTALANAIAVHAARIPATLLYARSQNNNHLLTEAAALYTSGLALPDHPHASQWLKTGRSWLAWCFTHQIDPDGEYVQHSMNYQRLMLQTALWVYAVSNPETTRELKAPLDAVERKNLGQAASWLSSRLDPVSGQAPNLGANDGALIFPLSNCSFTDYRPVTQAAIQAFLPTAGHLAPGLWDEMSIWYGLQQENGANPTQPAESGQIYAKDSWGSLRAVHYTSRPSHADQLHIDLWWRGLNIAQDAGTYRYNAEPPWDNQLTSTLVHNTVSVNGEEQMTRAGRFLYLDWAEAAFTEQAWENNTQHVSAQTTAYARFHVLHKRKLSSFADGRWLVEDELMRTASVNIRQVAPVYRLHWLLPDWQWQLDELEARTRLQILSPHGWISLVISADQTLQRVGLLRAGKLLQGQALLSPVFGWSAPTYDVKIPALSLSVEVQASQNFQFNSEFIFPTVSEASA